ncbi:MAG TPA: DUF4174 domain-containing protein [Acetobacteraceae bacterium]|nr:DUF4174 domain-containing protein [Acetobacteraceae bacterium]
MPRLVLFIVALVAALPALAQDSIPVLATETAAPGEPPQPTLEDLLWVARPLVVFADTPDDPRFVQQLRMLEAEPGPLAERNVVILTDADPAAKSSLRHRLRPRDFGLVLIDIDGTVAQRRPVPTSVRELVNLIDRMPSRREETGSRRP